MTLWGIGPRMFLHTAWISSPLVVAHVLFADRLRAEVPAAAWWYAAGGAMALTGLILVRIASRRIRRHIRAGELCVTGPYRLCRHPLYAAWMLLVFPALAVAARLPLLLGVPLVMYLVFRRLIRREEADLEQAFGERYRRYRAETPLLLPRLFARRK